jgi:hypothetical protein
MPREQTPVRPVQIDYRCDACGEGYYRPTGIMLTSSPLQFPHICNKCGDTKTFIEKYPTLRYVLEGTLMDLNNYKQEPM